MSVTVHSLPRAGLLILLLPLVACGELSWKRGAREQDWKADRAACAKEVQFNRCMQTRGWYLRGLEDADGAVAAGVLFDPDAALAGGNDGGGAVTSTLRQAVPSAATLARLQGNPAHAAGSVASPEVRQAPPARTAARDPLERVEVRIWWKPGGAGEEVDAEIARCAEKLGPEHAPEAGRYTLGLLSCLKTAGWRALRVGETTR